MNPNLWDQSLYILRTSLPDDSDTHCSLRAVGWRMNELTFGAEALGTQRTLLACTCRHALWACARILEGAHTFLPYPCDFVPTALLHWSVLPHLVTWRNFSYLLNFCSRLTFSVVPGRAYRSAYMCLFKASFNNHYCYDNDNWNVFSALVVLISLCIILFIFHHSAVRWAFISGHEDNKFPKLHSC